MATTLQASSSSCPCCINSSSRSIKATTNININAPKLRPSLINLPNPNDSVIKDVFNNTIATTSTQNIPREHNSIATAELYAIMEAVADRVEMHKNIGIQHDNWNKLLLASINAITLTAATMAGIAAVSAASGPLLPLKLSSTILYLAATGMLVVMNKIQPSQLAEEQRNAARLFKHLHSEIQTKLSIGSSVLASHVKETHQKVLALDRAYPLPLLDKFPATVETAVWWPEKQEQETATGGRTEENGWSVKLEEEMRGIVGVLKRKDREEYLRLSKIALKVNRALAMSGPVLTGLGAIGSALMGSLDQVGSWAMVVGVVGGALASVVNTVEHGGQVGMVFEMYRSNAGFFKLMEETIESNLKERDVERRENGELLKLKMGLQLGRSFSELKNLVASSTNGGEAIDEFASKLF